MPFNTGERLGHYEVISLIGSGGMGDVYRARDPRLGREVAVKTLRSAGADARARLWREARAAASVSHPSVCQIHDVGETSDNIYIVMELLQGEPLAHRLKDGPLNVDEAITVTLSVLGALTALHSRRGRSCAGLPQHHVESPAAARRIGSDVRRRCGHSPRAREASRRPVPIG
jgi:eukaryotic-like serine/threonine-protein kinase